MMDRAAGLAAAVRGLGVLLAGMGSCIWGLARAHRERPMPAVPRGRAWEPTGRSA